MDAETLNVLGQLGGVLAGAIVVAVILREIAKIVLPLIGKKGDSAKQIHKCVPEDVDLRKMAHQVDDLHEWHDVRDADGAPVWYLRKSLLETMDTIAKSQTQIAEVLKSLAAHMEVTRDTATRIEGRLAHSDYDHKEN